MWSKLYLSYNNPNLRLKLFAIEFADKNPKKQIQNQGKELKSMIISHSLSLSLNISQLLIESGGTWLFGQKQICMKKIMCL